MLKAIQIEKKINQNPILKGVSVELKDGAITALVGASGAGKTTLLQILGALDKPDSGEIYFESQALHQMNRNQLASFRNKNLGFVFQFHNLMAEFNALENVLIPADIAKTARRISTPKAKELLHSLGLANHFERKPHELSGGECQRVAVARALINQPKLILADEPTGNLDANNSFEMFGIFQKLAREHKITFFIATHNEQLANKADYKIVIKDGKIINEEALNSK